MPASRDQSHPAPPSEFSDQLGSLTDFVVLMVAGGWSLNGKTAQQLAGVASILAGDQVDFTQQAKGPRTEVLQVANRSCYHVQSTRHFLVSG